MSIKIVSSTLYDSLHYFFNEKDEEHFIFLKEKYLYHNPKIANKKCAWEDKL